MPGPRRPSLGGAGETETTRDLYLTVTSRNGECFTLEMETAGTVLGWPPGQSPTVSIVVNGGVDVKALPRSGESLDQHPSLRPDLRPNGSEPGGT